MSMLLSQMGHDVLARTFEMGRPRYDIICPISEARISAPWYALTGCHIFPSLKVSKHYFV